MTCRPFIAALMVGLATVTAPTAAYAQAFGIGPRFSFVRGDLTTGTPSTRFFGGTVRLRTSKRVVLEGAMDFRTDTSANGLERRREQPMQASLLLFPVRSTFSPYLLGGFGLYNVITEAASTPGTFVETSRDKKTGWHLGLGAELSVSRHAALYADYRFRFVRFGTAAADEEPISIPFNSTVKLAHKGSMWTSGIAFYF
jgi:opacity protein-like surface antigen